MCIGDSDSKARVEQAHTTEGGSENARHFGTGISSVYNKDDHLLHISKVYPKEDTRVRAPGLRYMRIHSTMRLIFVSTFVLC